MPRSAHGMTLAHIGLAVTAAGIAASAWAQERIEIVHPGGTLPIAGFVLHLDEVSKAQGPNFTADRASITVTKAGDTIAVLHPEKRFFPLQQMPTSMTAIHSNLLADLYVALGDSDGKGGWTVRVYWKPLVPWIWIGAVFMAWGGLISLSDRRWRVGVAARARAPRAAQPAE
jgi:cytochrome c-type biogenesis protein CcmF